MRYTQSELDIVQERWRLRFPDDLLALLLEEGPLLRGVAHFDWRTTARGFGSGRMMSEGPTGSRNLATTDPEQHRTPVASWIQSKLSTFRPPPALRKSGCRH